MTGEIRTAEPPTHENSANRPNSIIGENYTEGNGKRQKGLELWRKHINLTEIFEKIQEPTIHYGFLVENAVNLIIANAGEGKSYLSLSVAIDLAKKDEDMAVFYIDMDNPDWVAKVRGIQEILESNQLDNFVYIVRNEDIQKAFKTILEEAGVLGEFEKEYMTNKAVAWIYAIKKTVKKEKVLIVFDSLQRFIDYNDYKQVSDMYTEMERLKQKGFTFLIIHHKNKEGRQKGLQLLVDNCDQYITVDNVLKNDDNEITEQTLILDKARAGNKSVVNVKYIDLLTFAVMADENELTKDEKLVLNIAVSTLKKQEKLQQNELIQAIIGKVSVGEKKTRKILNRFEDKLFVVEKGERRTKIYSLNQNSELLKFFEEGRYTGTKKALLDTVIALQGTGEELTQEIELEIAGKKVVYKSLDAIRNNILKMSNEEADEILEILAERYQD